MKSLGSLNVMLSLAIAILEKFGAVGGLQSCREILGMIKAKMDSPTAIDES